MTTVSDFGVSINGVDYSAFWNSIDVKEILASQAVIQISLQGTNPSDFTNIANGNTIQIYEFDGAGASTLRFLGVVSSAKRIGFSQMAITGYDNAYALMNQNVISNNAGSVALYSVTGLTIGTIVNQLCSVDLSGSGTMLVTVGTVDNSANIVAEFSVPIVSRWEALVILAKKMSMELYMNTTTGTLNLVTHRGNVSSVFTYNLTGASTNAHSAEHTFTGQNVINDVIALSPAKQVVSRYQDFSPTFCKTTFSDARSTQTGTLVSGVPMTIYLNNTDGWPASGTVILTTVRPSVASVFAQFHNIVSFDYTSKTATSISGTPVVPAFGYTLDPDTPVLLQNTIVVDDNTAFPASGFILIGDEIIPYSAKTGSTGFTVSTGFATRRHVAGTANLNGALAATATTIPVISSGTFDTAGIITIQSPGNYEIISYTGTVGSPITSFTGCTRGIFDTNATAHKDLIAVVAGPGGSPKVNGYSNIHPRGVLVYNYVQTGVPETNSSINIKGRFTKVLRTESSTLIEDVENVLSRTLEQHRWGDQRAQLIDPNVFNFSSVLMGDKITANDSTLSWSSFSLRVLAKHFVLNRRVGQYNIVYDVGSYDDGATEAMLQTDAANIQLSGTGAKSGTIGLTNSDASLNAGGNNAISQQPVSFKGSSAWLSSDNANGFLFANFIWADATNGTAHANNVYLYGFTLDASGNATMPGTLSVAGALTVSGATGITGTLTAQTIIPATDNTYDLGTSTSVRWRHVFSVDATIGASDAALNIKRLNSSEIDVFPIGSTTNITLDLGAKGSGALALFGGSWSFNGNTLPNGMSGSEGTATNHNAGTTIEWTWSPTTSSTSIVTCSPTFSGTNTVNVYSYVKSRSSSQIKVVTANNTAGALTIGVMIIVLW